MSTTDKALHDNKLSQLVLGGGAAASILLPQAVTKAMPQLFAGIAPVTALLHRRVRQLRWKLRGERGRYGFSCYLS